MGSGREAQNPKYENISDRFHASSESEKSSIVPPEFDVPNRILEAAREVKKKTGRAEVVISKIRQLINNISEKSFNYSDFLKRWKNFKPNNILLFNGLLPGEDERLGDTLIFHRPIVQYLLEIFPSSIIHIVTTHGDLWNLADPRIKVILLSDILAASDKDVDSWLVSMKKEENVDLAINMGSDYFPGWETILNETFENYITVNSGRGAEIKYKNKSDYFDLLPWKKYSFTRWNVYSDQVENIINKASGRNFGTGKEVVYVSNKIDEEWFNELFVDEGKRSKILINLFSKKTIKGGVDVVGVGKLINRLIEKDDMSVVLPASRRVLEDEILNSIISQVPKKLKKYLILPEEGGMSKLKILINNVDQIVTVNTGVAHLAHVMGKDPIELYRVNVLRQPLSFRHYWLSSEKTRRNKLYVTSFDGKKYKWEKVLGKIRNQKKQE